ncbi:phosphoribosylformylglycinamidine synthase subunit PurL [Isoptericola sp. b441]|uniref:Phosphoribosylformylglycinamidine synthase subunit PurL n=1 Tax=Actinotalea lenta TaxID=3064654 RepID=A0ABT9D559_9CELL|nr:MULTISPECIES: phosphoribosylformylglycinamidine synthase subunit PurL [unclassified Isoptericola]MDO8105889.1 phosphoribosylformylglycinamidine synthase subunit PurL [Isoptericola sp. b441]MDO8122605.1 phosphoribosylformylglycinamidine synthase subunit PurL [Isoptericola sp. b490]
MSTPEQAPDQAPAPDQAYDTVEHAAATSDQAMPWAELGLKADEYERIVGLLGRRPTTAELAMYSVMWSEHCSYKSSKLHLRQFGTKTTEAMREHLLAGMGENAGVVDIGDGWAVTFKVESHNHPSFVEPYQGAATGVGGIVRDIMAMGARPVAVMDQLRFGAVDHPDTARVVHGVVSGVGGYGNSLGLPNIGGEVVFDPAYQGNPLVNALCLGVLRHDELQTAAARGAGNKVILFGARTGGDGIGGASILASETFDDSKPSKRPSVQVGDPFMEKVLIECCLELYAAGVVEGIQDLGAAGISCATSEMASAGDGGMHVDLENVLLRDPTLTAGEILMSESQERMMAIVRPDRLEEFTAITAKWDVETAVIGEVTDTGRLTIDHHGRRIVDVEPRTVAVDSPVYDRPYARPAWQDDLQADTISGDAGRDRRSRPASGADLRATLLTLLASPNLSSKAWVTDQYDRFVQGNTALAQPDDAGVVRVDEATGLGVALSTDANGRYAKLDPYAGAQLALAEAYRNVATVGARPMAVTDCLNLGTPEHPDSMWQLVQVVTGLADACRDLAVPVTGGNVSLYNTSGEPGGVDASIHPTPVVGVLGVVDDVRRVTPSGWRTPGQVIYLLGTTRGELDGSAWADVVHSHLGGTPPTVDLAAERALAGVLVNAARDTLVDAAHDLSEGGLAIALAEACTRFGTGARIRLAELCTRDRITPFEALFSESTARAVVAVPRTEEVRFQDLCTARGVPALAIGVTDEVDPDAPDGADGPALVVDGLFRVPLADLVEASRRTLPAHFA